MKETYNSQASVILQCLPWEDRVEEILPSSSDLEQAIHDAEELVDEALFEPDYLTDVAS